MTTDDSGDFKSQFNVFWRSAVSGISDLKEAVVSTAKVGKLKLDATMMRRHREKLFLDLGRAAHLAIEGGRWEPDAAVRSIFEKIVELDAHLAADQTQVDDLLYKTELEEDDAPQAAPSAPDVVDAKTAEAPEAAIPASDAADAPADEVVDAKEKASKKRAPRKKKTP